mmetsp:Transcript_34960/g.64737  ORF Transcript_34960/g.64737 Transcript_34960/m.64737 type:complete len:140 (-) Transcript_34960:63-482(-)
MARTLHSLARTKNTASILIYQVEDHVPMWAQRNSSKWCTKNNRNYCDLIKKKKNKDFWNLAFLESPDHSLASSSSEARNPPTFVRLLCPQSLSNGDYEHFLCESERISIDKGKRRQTPQRASFHPIPGIAWSRPSPCLP